MSDLFNTVVSELRTWSFVRILIYSVLLLTVYTAINIYVPKKQARVCSCIVLICIMAAAFTLTLFRRSDRAVRTVRLIPFKRLFTAKHPIFKTLWLNAFLFLPFGLSLPYVLPERIRLRHRILTTVISAAVFSLCIELFQLVFRLG